MKATEFTKEEKVRLDPKCWKGKKIGNPKTKMKGGVRVNNCVPAESVEEEWSQKYKDSINCSNPKGFSQKAHCAGKKKHNESVKENRAYYNVIGTPDSELRSTFGMRKDRNGWFLSENVDKRKQLAAFRAFGAPKLKEYNLASFSGSAAIKGEDNVISPVGSGRKGK